MRKGKYRGTYETYSQQFEANKKQGLIQQGVRKLGKNQWANEIRQGMTNTSILENQSLNKKAAKRAFEQYNKIVKKNMKPGETSLELQKTYWGNNALDKNKQQVTHTMGYHRTLSGFLHDKNAIHMMISYEIMSGRSREEVLDDYGYHD